MRKSILSSVLDLRYWRIFTLCRMPIPAPNVLGFGVLSIVLFMYIGYLVVKSIFLLLGNIGKFRRYPLILECDSDGVSPSY